MLNNLKKEAIPERIFSLLKIVEEKSPIPKKDLSSILIPDDLNQSSSSYFGPVFEGAQELKLIDIDNDSNVLFIGNKSDIKNMSCFRRYCNEKLFIDSSTDLYKVLSCILSLNDELLKYGSITTSTEVNRIICNKTGIISQNLEKGVLLGLRFWYGFLGFGFANEKYMLLLPNMYHALKDFMKLGNIDEGQEYSVEEFLDNLHSGSSVALKNARETLSLNLAMSNALRLLHDNKEIELKIHLDSEKKWHMFPNEEHEFTSEITHIFISKAVK